MPKVTVIPSTINPITQMPIHANHVKKVAAYARVSTNSDEQYTSYEAQVNFYKKYIQEKPDWKFTLMKDYLEQRPKSALSLTK